MTWSADFPADDWTRISPAQVYSRALQRIEANGKGILLLHDIQAKTVEALPALLHELKRRGYHIVHVVPATPDRPKTATAPSQWIMHAHGRQIWPGVVRRGRGCDGAAGAQPGELRRRSAVRCAPDRVDAAARPPGVPPRSGAAGACRGLAARFQRSPGAARHRPLHPAGAEPERASAIPRPRRRPGCTAQGLAPVLLAPQASLAPIPIPVTQQAPLIVPPETDALAMLIKPLASGNPGSRRTRHRPNRSRDAAAGAPGSREHGEHAAWGVPVASVGVM